VNPGVEDLKKTPGEENAQNEVNISLIDFFFFFFHFENNYLFQLKI